MPSTPTTPPSSPALPLDLADEIVAFFRALSADARREYATLAELDRRFGEDIERERRENESDGDATREDEGDGDGDGDGEGEGERSK